MRGLARGFQGMVRPDSALSGARIRFDPLVHSNGTDRIDPRWLAYHFVDYVSLSANAGQTPVEERVWNAPADFPDELSDEPVRDLPTGQVQPIFIRVTAPVDAAPGSYTGTGRLECAAGTQTFTISAQVVSPALAVGPLVHVEQWFRWDLLCQEFGVDDFSEDGWRALSALAAMLHAHRHDYLKTPWDLVRSWREPGGALRHDFRDFDRFVDTFLAEDPDFVFALSHVGHRGCPEWECPTMVSKSHGYRNLESADVGSIDVVDLLPAIEAHVTARGLLDRFAVHVADEPTGYSVASYRTLPERVRTAAPNLPRIDAILTPDLMGYLEIWVPLLDQWDSNLSTYRAAQAAGNELWFYVAWVPQWYYPNRLIDGFAIKPRILHWLNGIYDFTGYLHWALMVQLHDALMSQGLTKAAAQARVEAVARVPVRHPTDYSRSWHELEAARLELLQQLEGAGRPLRVSLSLAPPTQAVLNWDGYSGLLYRVMGSTNLREYGGGFVEMGSYPGAEGVNAWTQSVPGAVGFYGLER